MFEAVEDLIGEHADLESELADPAVHADQANARKLDKRYAELTPIVGTYRAWKQARRGHRDGPRARGRRPRLRRRGQGLTAQREELDREAAPAAGPARPDDDKDVILEIKAGEGGEESALFAGDLLRMYLRYAERVGWKTEIIDANESDLGGYKDVRSP